jgi:hypothetical protein
VAGSKDLIEQSRQLTESAKAAVDRAKALLARSAATMETAHAAAADDGEGHHSRPRTSSRTTAR